ncbi:MAG: hypothetical protein HUJ30_09685 [Gammaproteobacteria bacterium]|nr:hypothetical protein [Gammaproteobacteria bacterium]
MKKLILIGLLALLAGCDNSDEHVKILFAEVENGIEPYTSRTIISPDFMRIDYNEDDNDFILYDRKTKTVYSIVNGDQSIVVIAPREHDTKSPIKLNLAIEAGKLGKDAPTVDGKQPKHFIYTVNNKVCYDTISVEGLLPVVGEIYSDYLATLAGEHARILPVTPADLQNGCDLANNIFAIGRQFEKGFPINEWHGEYNNGYKRQLIDYQTGYKADPKLFKLPENYRRFTPDTIGAIPEGS